MEPGTESIYTETVPNTRLARFVECYWQRVDAPGEQSHCVLPDGCVDLLFSAGDLHVVGLMTTPKWVESVPGRSWFGVRFRPAMATAFIPHAAELANRMEPLTGNLRDRLGNVTEFDKWCAAVNRTLHPADIPRFAEARSERQQRRVCAQRAGVGPKYLSRILRFRRAVEGIGTDRPDWARFAAEHGYYDQAHFIHEFQEFAGCTPGRYLQSKSPTPSIKSKYE